MRKMKRKIVAACFIAASLVAFSGGSYVWFAGQPVYLPGADVGTSEVKVKPVFELKGKTFGIPGEIVEISAVNELRNLGDGDVVYKITYTIDEGDGNLVENIGLSSEAVKSLRLKKVIETEPIEALNAYSVGILGVKGEEPPVIEVENAQGQYANLSLLASNVTWRMEESGWRTCMFLSDLPKIKLKIVDEASSAFGAEEGGAVSLNPDYSNAYLIAGQPTTIYMQTQADGGARLSVLRSGAEIEEIYYYGELANNQPPDFDYNSDPKINGPLISEDAPLDLLGEDFTSGQLRFYSMEIAPDSGRIRPEPYMFSLMAGNGEQLFADESGQSAPASFSIPMMGQVKRQTKVSYYGFSGNAPGKSIDFGPLYVGFNMAANAASGAPINVRMEAEAVQASRSAVTGAFGEVAAGMIDRWLIGYTVDIFDN
ncbi:MAG: hypothetical protein LBU32_21685 [Clostridiales bacterium]|jgi:hypothetical protein|nr:hypothetical protein [Clostridiales bacterium]